MWCKKTKQPLFDPGFYFIKDIYFKFEKDFFILFF